MSIDSAAAAAAPGLGWPLTPDPAASSATGLGWPADPPTTADIPEGEA